MVDRYRCFGKDDFGHEYTALSTVDDDGDWVRFEDYERIVQGARDLLDRAEQNQRVMVTLLNDADFTDKTGGEHT